MMHIEDVKKGWRTKIVAPLVRVNQFSLDELTTKHGTAVLSLLPLVHRH